jgi:hypothetical protein
MTKKSDCGDDEQFINPDGDQSAYCRKDPNA